MYEYGTCPICGETILDGEDIVELDSMSMHRECCFDNAYSILFDYCGAAETVAMIDEGW